MRSWFYHVIDFIFDIETNLFWIYNTNLISIIHAKKNLSGTKIGVST